MEFLKDVFNSWLGRIFLVGYVFPAIITALAMLAYYGFQCRGMFPDTTITCASGAPDFFISAGTVLGILYLFLSTIPALAILLIAIGLTLLRRHRQTNKVASGASIQPK